MTGCGALSAMANPKVAWAIQDPAPMSVVVRRADAAEATAKQVDRILTATPASPDADWLKTVGPKPEDAAGEVKAIKDEPMYAKSHARVVPAEVWARTLGRHPEHRRQLAQPPRARLERSRRQLRRHHRARRPTSRTPRRRSRSRRTAKDAKGASDADKKPHDKTIDELEKKVSKLEDEVDPLRKKFLEAAKEAAQKAPATTRDAVGPVLVNLRQAVDDASIADGAAAVRFPLAIKSLPDSLQEVVPVFVADIVEEQTGHRPTMNGFKPDIKLDGTDVKLTLNGLGPDDLGKLSMGDLTTQTLDRTKKWVVHAITLLAAVSSTKDTLSFEQDTLDALLDGFGAGGWKAAEAVKIPDEKDPKVASATAKVRAHVKATVAKAGVAEAQGSKSTAAKAASTKSDAPAKGADRTTAKKPSKKSAAAATTKPATTPANPKSTTTAAGPPAPMRPEDFNP